MTLKIQHTGDVSIEMLRLYDVDKNFGGKLSTSMICIEIIA